MLKDVIVNVTGRGVLNNVMIVLTSIGMNKGLKNLYKIDSLIQHMADATYPVIVMYLVMISFGFLVGRYFKLKRKPKEVLNGPQ